MSAGFATRPALTSPRGKRLTGWSKLSRHERGYGYKWEKLRKRILSRDKYLCQPCLASGRPTPANEVDHIKPKADGGTDDPANLQAICRRCHRAKTINDNDKTRGGAQAHPTWLPKPSCPVTIVCGPAGAGKSTWAYAQASDADDVIDLDDCFTIVCGKHGHQADQAMLPRALRLRNKRLAKLEHKTRGQAFFIVSAPTKAEREWWQQKLGGQIHLIKPTLDEIETRDVSAKQLDLAVQWFEAEQAGEWTAPKEARRVGLDGYPV